MAALRVVVANYRDFDVVLYSRAMNRAELFVDETLEAPLLAALDDQQYECQAWAAIGCRALRLRSAVPRCGRCLRLTRGQRHHRLWPARQGCCEAGPTNVAPWGRLSRMPVARFSQL
jgi:hypothetical protein